MPQSRPSLPVTSPERPIQPGDVVAGKYRFERLLGEGAQGWVWQAHNLSLDVPVAIKVVRTEGDDDQTLPQRLFREARAAARLGHPAIVRVFDLGQAPNGAPFLVMELLEGQTLADKLLAGPLAPEAAIRLLLPIADALLAAHAKGIVHRDVKPDNVFLAVTGESLQPKLVDFGIAKITRESGPSRHITQSGAVVGSPAYLSPEQARGLHIDARADVWSFCATLYECLTGELPFDGSTWRALREHIISGEPRSILEHGVGDERLWKILRRGLAKDAEERWPTMFALGCALARWLFDRGVTADVCGVSLESRWFRGEPLGPRDALGETLLSPGAIPESSDLPSDSDAPSGSAAPSPEPRAPRTDRSQRRAAWSSRLRGAGTRRRWLTGVLGAAALVVLALGVARTLATPHANVSAPAQAVQLVTVVPPLDPMPLASAPGVLAATRGGAEAVPAGDSGIIQVIPAEDASPPEDRKAAAPATDRGADATSAKSRSAPQRAAQSHVPATRHAPRGALDLLDPY